jgi:RimJ/RimL family protein N-acetyltransferase
MHESVQFLARRGFEEIQRDWESRLNVPEFDLGAFARAEERAERQGIVLTTVVSEGVQSEDVRRQIYELDCRCSEDEPSVDPITPAPFERWAKDNLDSPWSLPEAYFLAKAGDRYVGLSALFLNTSLPDVLQQGFTAVDRDHRGKGVAMALKLRGVKYALARGTREIRTHNNTRNRPMLRINEAMGFVKEPVWIEYEKKLGER